MAVTADNFAGASGQEHAIRYAGVGLYQGRSLDMVITQAVGAPTADCGIAGNDACRAQSAMHWGGIGVQRGAGMQIYGTATLQYTDSRQPAVVPLFCMTFVDIGRGDGPTEYVTIADYGNSFASYVKGGDLQVQNSQLSGTAAKTFLVRPPLTF